MEYRFFGSTDILAGRPVPDPVYLQSRQVAAPPRYYLFLQEGMDPDLMLGNYRDGWSYARPEMDGMCVFRSTLCELSPTPTTFYLATCMPF